MDTPSSCPSNPGNHRAAISTIVIACFSIVWYLVDILVTCRCLNDGPIKATGAALNSLSALLAIGVGILFVFASWPQPLTDAGFMTLLLAQASALGWYKYTGRAAGQDRDRKGLVLEALLDKIPDVGAVGAAVFGLWVAQEAYITNTGNEFFTKHEPIFYGYFAAALAGWAACVGILAFVGEKMRTASNLLIFVANLLFGVAMGGWIINVANNDFCGLYRVAGIVTGCALITGAIVSAVFFGFTQMTKET